MYLFLNGQKPMVVKKPNKRRNSKWRLAKSRDQDKALIPNETNKVRSHINYPKYLEYKVIHLG
jgi:hypothetical protein